MDLGGGAKERRRSEAARGRGIGSKCGARHPDRLLLPLAGASRAAGGKLPRGASTACGLRWLCYWTLCVAEHAAGQKGPDRAPDSDEFHEVNEVPFWGLKRGSEKREEHPSVPPACSPPMPRVLLLSVAVSGARVQLVSDPDVTQTGRSRNPRPRVSVSNPFC